VLKESGKRDKEQITIKNSVKREWHDMMDS
jgi:hypothetical protein